MGMAFIILMAIIIYITFIFWTWQSMQTVETPKKIAFIIIGIIIIYIITLIVFAISKNGIEYQNVQMQKQVKNVIVSIFTGLNCVIVMPQIAKNYEKMKNEEIEKDIFLKKILIIAIVFVICLIFEIGYMKSMQQGIFKIYNFKRD